MGEEMKTNVGDFNELHCFDSYFSEYQQESCSDYRLFYDDQSFSILSPSQFPTCSDQAGGIQNTIQQDVEPKKKTEHPFPLSSLGLLNNYGKGFKRLNSQRIIKSSNTTPCTSKLSTEEIVRIAGERFIRSCTSRVDVASMLDNPFNLSFSSLSREEADVKLVEFLLASAEKVSDQQFDLASRLLEFCDSLSSNTGNPIQRLVYYFSEALQGRIDSETGKITSKGPGKCNLFAIDHLVITPNSSIQACYEGIPFYQASHLTGSQVIIENVAEAKRIQIIDFKIRNGLQWPILIQALASRQCDSPLELLKITAVETCSKHLIEDTGNRLSSFAQAMNIPFSFKIVMVSDMLDLKEDLFEIDNEEVVAVYSEYALMNFIVQRDQIESVMRVIRNIKPRIMVVIESEANHNSPIFINRFVEALFYFSAYFDCVDACMGQDDPNRMIMESLFLGEGIRNIVTSEGENRDIRNVKISVWRTFFAQFGMVETELSESCLYQAKLAVGKFACGKYCTFGMDGKSLIIAWKGTPILSFTTWKFICQQEEGIEEE